jgi:hypothetical protein
MVLPVNPPGDSVAGAAMAMFPGADAPPADVADAAPKANPMAWAPKMGSGLYHQLLVIMEMIYNLPSGKLT